MDNQEVIIKILGRTTMEMPEIDQMKLRGIVEEVLSDYIVQVMPKALVPANNMRERIMMYIAIKQTEGRSIKTLKNYARYLQRFSEFVNKNVEDITATDIRLFLAKMLKQNKVKNTTLETIRAYIKSFFSWLEDEDMIRKSPARQIKPMKVEKRLVEALTIDELEEVREACKDIRERAIVEVLYSTGCRLSEVVNIGKDQIDYGNKCVNVIGKGNEERTVYFSEKAMHYLRKYILSRKDDNEALFVSERQPYNGLGGRGIQKIISQIAARTSIKKGIHPHVFRHTLATLMLNNGADIASVQQILDHKDPSTTQIYATVTEQHKKETYRKYLVQ